MKKTKIYGALLNFFILLLFLLGILLIFNDKIKDYIIRKRVEENLVDNLSVDEIKKNEESKGSFDFESVEGINYKNLILDRKEEKKLKHGTIGEIAIPKVNIRLPIFKGVSNDVLICGAGTMKEGEKMGEGNYALASHHTKNRDLLFTPLERVGEGDEIYLTDLENIYIYKTYTNKKVSPDSTHIIEDVPNKKIITLVTCGESEGITRIIVQGELKSIIPLNSAGDNLKEIFNLN